MEDFLKWVYEKSPLLATGLALILATGYVVWKFSTIFHTRFKPMEESVKKFDEFSNCKNHYNDLESLKEMVRNIERILLKNDINLMDSLSITKSPRQLSEIGIQLYNESGCKDLILGYTDYFIGKLEERNPKTALDVETESHSVLLSLSDEDKFKKIKDYLYNHPKFENSDIDINTLCFVMSLELRNIYLQKHKEIIEE